MILAIRITGVKGLGSGSPEPKRQAVLQRHINPEPPMAVGSTIDIIKGQDEVLLKNVKIESIKYRLGLTPHAPAVASSEFPTVIPVEYCAEAQVDMTEYASVVGQLDDSQWLIISDRTI